MRGIDRFFIAALCACILGLSIKNSIYRDRLNVMDRRLDIANERIDLLRKHVNELDSTITYPTKQDTP